VVASRGGDSGLAAKGDVFRVVLVRRGLPCTWSALTAKATLGRCRALLAYHVESGQINDVDVSGVNFGWGREGQSGFSAPFSWSG
jgi:hypothetical protein